MKTLITGNMGYVGPVVARHLRRVDPGCLLAGLDAGYFGNCVNAWDAVPERFVNIQHYADIRFVQDYMLEGIEAVVHLAGISNDPVGNRFKDATSEINHLATVQLARQAKRLGISSFVFASSCSVYGAAQDEARVEGSRLDPLTAYARSKLEAERDLEPLADEGFRITCLRFSTACGMSERLRLDLVLNDFVAAAIVSGRVTVLSDGTPWRPLIDVKDMARAVEWAIGRKADCGGPFLTVNVGRSDWNYRVRELAEAVALQVPGAEVSINRNAQPDNRSYRVDFKLFRQLAPLHQPRSDLATTIRELTAGLQAIGFRDADFRNSQFIRLRALDRLRSKGLLNEKLWWVDGDDHGGNE